MIRDQQLRQGQRIAMSYLATIVVIAELIGAQRPQIGQMFPDRLFQSAACSRLTLPSTPRNSTGRPQSRPRSRRIPAGWPSTR